MENGIILTLSFKLNIFIQCSDALTYITPPSRYLIGLDSSVSSFQSAMDKCLTLGAHSVHITSEEERHLIKEYIRNSGNISYLLFHLQLYTKSGICSYLWGLQS